ncbi:hypothetical protein GCM10020331_006580 [Ectobacillus funiculus]
MSRKFVSELGVSYSEYVQNEKVQRAAALLKTTDLSIKDIAKQTGFKNGSLFYPCFFHSVMGSPPGIFRLLYVDSKTTEYTEN